MPNNDSNSNNRNNYNNYNNYNNEPKKCPVSSIAIWESGGIKIFTGSQDGFWRLWNASSGFVKEFESNMNGKVYDVKVVNNFLFCGFEAISRTLPNVTVGMVHAWNLQQPNHPPVELQLNPQHLPYAHNHAVSTLLIAGDGANAKVVSGSQDGSIRVWSFQGGQFTLAQTLVGHAREVTGLILLPTTNLLWSSGTDACIRIWNLTSGDCQHVITRNTPDGQATTPPAGNTGNQPQGVGHTHAVTALLSFESPAGTFILSSSLDRTVKAWNGATGQCVANELHDEGVVCMSLSKDQKGNQLLLLGMESGNIICRNLVQTPKVNAFQLLFCLTARFTVAHKEAVKCITSGPQGTFYSGGSDGKMLVFQFVNDLGLQ